MKPVSSKKAVFFTLDILVAIVLVFMFSIFVISNISYTFADSQITDLQLSSMSSDLYLLLYTKGYIQDAISGSNADVSYVLNTGLPEQICSSIQIYDSSSLLETITKSSCIQQNSIVIVKAPLQYDQSNYRVEVKTWVQ